MKSRRLAGLISFGVFVGVMTVIAVMVLRAFFGEDPEARARAVVVAERVAAYDADPLDEDALKAFEADVRSLKASGIRRVAGALEMRMDELGVAKVRLAGYPVVESEEAWKAPSRVLARRMMDLDPEKTLDEALWRTWPVRFSVAYVEEYSRREPEKVWRELMEFYETLYGKFHEDMIPLDVDWAYVVAFALETEQGKPGRSLIVREDFSGKKFADRFQSSAQMAMLRSAVESHEVEEFLEWKLNEGAALPDEWISSSFPVRPPFNAGITGLALSLLAKEDPQRAIKWAGNHTLEMDFHWRGCIAAGWFEFWPETREDVPRYETKYEDLLDWLLRTVAEGDSALHNSYYQWQDMMPIEAKRWLDEEADEPPMEEVKANLRKSF